LPTRSNENGEDSVTVAALPRNSIRLRGRSLLAFVLAPEAPLDQWMRNLDDWLARSPGFFTGRPVLLDVTGLRLDRADLAVLLTELRDRSIRIMGVEGADAAWLELGMPPAVNRDRQAGMAEILEGAMRANMDSKNGPANSAPLIVDGPVRSGQSIIHPDGDVTVTGAISSGAEVIAAGSIHVYGALRGRAIAGSAGNAVARIFCNRLEAEYLGIDGHYCTADEMDPHIRGQRVQAWVDGEELKIAPLNRNQEGR
jgi:septum site-determining protein MinC